MSLQGWIGLYVVQLAVLFLALRWNLFARSARFVMGIEDGTREVNLIVSVVYFVFVTFAFVCGLISPHDRTLRLFLFRH